MLSNFTTFQSAREKERARDLVAASEYCSNMAVELTAIASSICSAKRLLKSVDQQRISLLDVLIEKDQKDVSDSFLHLFFQGG